MNLGELHFEEDNSLQTKFTYEEDNKDIGIIGMALKLPEADTFEKFWSDLVNGAVSIRTIPKDRKKDIDKYMSYIGKEQGEYLIGGYLEDIDTFDYDFFKITPREASLMDPKQRLFLEIAWRAIEDAGYTHEIIDGSKTGVYVGFSDEMNYYSMVQKINPNFKDMAFTGNLKSILSGRVAYTFNLKGLAVNIDSACSSSLVSLHMACKGIQNGDCDMAIAGGIKLDLFPFKDKAKLGIESENNEVRAFDDAADGTVWGEGVVAFLLKPLSKAEEAGDHVYAIIKGSAVNQDGNTINGITSPNVLSQEEVIINAWRDAEIDPKTISYIESHGTGTKLGDPIEFTAIDKAFKHFTDRKNFCTLGTLKSNIGHLVECSGAASVAKAILSLQHRCLTPCCNFNTPNRGVNFENSALYLNKDIKKWDADSGIRRCGISSFGFSGTNCHLVLEEYIPKANVKDNTELVPQILTLSARNEEELKVLIESYIEFLNKTNENLEDICYTTNIGRRHYSVRMAVIGDSVKALRKKLLYTSVSSSFGSNDNINIFVSNETVKAETEDTQRMREIIGKMKEAKDKRKYIKELCKLYVSGANIDWMYYHSGRKCYKISLPGYPLKKDRCWIELNERLEEEDKLESSSRQKDYVLCGRPKNDYTETEIRVADVVYNILGYKELDIYENIYQRGGSSIMLVKICNELNKYFGNKLKISDIISYPTIKGLSDYIDNNINYKKDGKNVKKEPETIKSNEYNDKNIAVIGISIKFPGANNVEEYWDNIINCKSFIKDFPKERKKQMGAFIKKIFGEDQNINYEKGGYLDSVDEFDYEFFKISYKDACLMDPNQRQFVEATIRAIEDAGYSLDEVKSKNIGVFTGSSSATLFNYARMVFEMDRDSFGMAIIPNLPSIIPSRISYFLDFKGPSMNVDTACSSSMVAINLACEALRNKRCNMAIAGGVRIDLAPIDSSYKKLGVECPEAYVKVFDENSNGTLWGEGVAAIVLKPFKAAVADGDDIYAVIEGYAMNQDGTSMGITTPNSISQTKVIEDAWKDAGIDPRSISYIESHGTGTKIGDPIEIEGIQRAFDSYTDEKQFCAISSVKPNIGHLEAVSGAAALIKAVLALKHKIIPPIANFTFPNEKIDFLNSSMYLNDIPAYWEEKGGVRRCGVSSFGFSGTNSHVVLREFNNSDKRNIIHIYMPLILTISAKSKESLHMLIGEYKKLIVSSGNNINIEDICYTANISKFQFNNRIVICGRNINELIERINHISMEATLKTEKGIYYSGDIKEKGGKSYDNSNDGVLYKECDKLINLFLKNDKSRCKVLGRICELYALGINVEWNKLYKNESFNRTHLPSNLYSGKKCWIKTVQNGNDSEIILKGRENNEYSNLEKKIAKIWCDVIGLDEIDVTKEFYEVGGHSISMMKIISDMRGNLNYDVGYSNFAVNNTVEKLGRLIEKNDFKCASLAYPICKHMEKNIYEPFRLTEIQMSYLIGRQEAFSMGGVCTHVYMELATEYDIVRLEDSINKVIKRHPMLRTKINKDGTQQMIKDVPRFMINRMDISLLSKEEQETFILKKRDDLSHKVFKVDKWPYMEVEAAKISEKENYLFIGIDMLVADGASLLIIGNDVLSYYNDPNCSMDEIQVNMRDYITTYSEFKKSKMYKRDKAYWLAKLDKIPPAPVLPYKQLVEEIVRPYFKRVSKNYSKVEWNKLKKVASRFKVSVVSILCNAYAEVLANWSNQPQFTINFTVFNRYPFHPDINRVVGDFTSVLLISIDMENEEAFDKRTANIQNIINEALEHRHYDGVEVIRELMLKRSNKMEPAMPFVFTSMLFNEDSPWDKIGKVKYQLSQTPQVFLDNQVIDSQGELCINWDYVDNIFDENIISEMFTQYTGILDYLIEDLGED